jgi:hypothetical protein
MTAGAEVAVLHRAQQEVDRPLSAVELRAGVNLIQEVMKSVMKINVHFGTIPGTPKPTLYKAGAEKLLSTFRIAVDPIVEDLSSSDEARFRVSARASAQATGVHLGSGAGECSSSEEKYKWRAAICSQEFDETPEDRRREVWKRKRDGVEKIRQIRTNHADVSNTVLKMAVKRAIIAVTLQVTAASDIFSQDIEDLPEELQQLAHEDAPRFSEPQPAAEVPPPQPAPKENITPGIRVASVRVAKTGENEKGEWKLYVVGLSDGKEYSTFSESLAAKAKGLLSSKATVTFEFEDKNGKRNLILIEEVK